MGDTQYNFSAAQSYCESIGTNLVNVYGAGMDNYLSDLCAAQGHVNGMGCWIGLVCNPMILYIMCLVYLDLLIDQLHYLFICLFFRYMQWDDGPKGEWIDGTKKSYGFNSTKLPTIGVDPWGTGQPADWAEKGDNSSTTCVVYNCTQIDCYGWANVDCSAIAWPICTDEILCDADPYEGTNDVCYGVTCYMMRRY